MMSTSLFGEGPMAARQDIEGHLLILWLFFDAPFGYVLYLESLYLSKGCQATILGANKLEMQMLITDNLHQN